MNKILIELNEKINWYKGHLGEYQRNNDKENADYFKTYIDGLLFARDIVISYHVVGPICPDCQKSIRDCMCTNIC